MKRTLTIGFLRSLAWICVAAVGLAGMASPAFAHSKFANPPSVRVLMVSDIHFEPFWDPGKVPQLVAAPVSKWSAILAAPPTHDRAARFAALQHACHARGIDTSYPLYASSLRAMRADAAGAQFITLGGDLLSHEFTCKYAHTMPHSTPAARQAFAVKTLDFVMNELRGAFPGVPVYTALGNNDSGCNDYRFNADGPYLTAIDAEITADVPARERKQARRDFAKGGYYSVSLPAPMRRTELLVLNDNFMSRNYSTCGGKHDHAPAAAEIAWLRHELERASRKHENVWIMAHIPPGIDPFSTITGIRDICAGDPPVMFLSSEALPKTIADFGSVVRLAIFGHTHMDEMRLLRPTQGGAHEKPVVLKVVPSISPVDGNNPAFMVARVDPATAVLTDYKIIAASNKTGVGTQWSEEYDFDRTYDKHAFSSASVAQLIAGFRADPGDKTKASQNYLRDYFVGDRSDEIKAFWPEYSCALANYTPATFKACMCPAKRSALQAH